MSIEIKLNAFEGPLDLLLLLIEKNKVDIYDIPIAVITDQYMEYVEEMQQENLEILSDFLVMATTLLDIKSRMLLPKEEDENGEEIDPRKELVERLLEYQEYKMMAKELNEQYLSLDEPFFKDSSIPEEIRRYRQEPDPEEILSGVTLDRLRAVFEMVIRRQEEKVDPVRSRFGNIKKDPVRIADKLSLILDLGKREKRFSFERLLEGQHTKADTVVTFLAVLELVKVGQLFVHQEDIDSGISLEWNEECDNVLTKEDVEQYD